MCDSCVHFSVVANLKKTYIYLYIYLIIIVELKSVTLHAHIITWPECITGNAIVKILKNYVAIAQVFRICNLG